MSDRLENLWTRIKIMTGQCAVSTDLENLKDSVETAQSRINKVLIGGKLLQSDSRVFEKLTTANEALGAVGEALGTVQNVCLDLKAVANIHEAIVALDDEYVIINNPEVAAKAFGQLFTGFGRLCRHLPSPAKEWGQFLEGAGEFFVNWQRFVKNYTDRAMQASYGDRY
jgi:NACalpha-BTF3-like transcription factor